MTGPVTGPVLSSTWAPLWLQERILAADTGIDFVVVGIGGGKSQVAAEKLLRWALRYPLHPDGKTANQGLVMGKDFRNAGDAQFKKIRQQAGRLIPGGEAVPGPIIAHIRTAGEPVILLQNGVELKAFSGTDPDATRSHEFGYGWVDEAEFMDLPSFTTALGRLRGSGGIRMIVTSSPKGDGWMHPIASGEYEQWAQIRRENRVTFWRWRSEDNPATAATLPTIRAAQNAQSPDLALAELDGRFLGTAEAPGSGAIDYVKAFVGRLAAEEKAVVVGADLGKSADYCWFTALSRSGVVTAQDRFQLGDVDVTAADYWPLAQRRLIEFCEREGASEVLVDASRGGDHFTAALRERLERWGGSLRVRELPTNANSKRSDLIEGLGMAIALGRFRVPTAHGARVVDHVEELRIELKHLVPKPPRDGRRMFGTDGTHKDDGVIAGALAWRALSELPRETELVNPADWGVISLPGGRRRFS